MPTHIDFPLTPHYLMELALKAWLVDNAVTTDDKTDQILQLESAGKVDIEAIYKEMFNKTTGIQPETIMHVVQLYHRTVTDFLLTGCTVNTGLFYASPSFQGIYKDVWDPEKNSIVVNFQTGKELRESIAQTKDRPHHQPQDQGRRRTGTPWRWYPRGRPRAEGGG